MEISVTPSDPNLPDSLREGRRQNPFGPRPGESPPYLAGRTSQIDAWARPVRRLIDFGRGSAPLFFTGPRGLGKTVLLRRLQSDAIDAGFVTAWITASPAQDLISAIVNSAREAAVRSPLHKSPVERSRIDDIKMSTGLPGVLKLEASVIAPERVSNPFAQEIADLAREVRSLGAAGLMLFIDELQSAPSGDIAAVARAMQEWTGTQVDTPLMLVGSGPIQLSRVLAAHGGFAERFSYLPLERLSDLDAMSAFTSGMPDVFKWLPGALESAVMASEGHPYMIQLIGHHAWEESGSSTIERPFYSVGDIEVAVQKARTEIRRVFEGRWADTPDQERVVLAALASSRAEALTRHEIADASTTLSFREVESAVDSLYANGWLDVDGLDRIRIGLPGVGDFVRQRQP